MEVETEECLYWIALTYYALGEHRASRVHVERLLRMDPAHKKALQLHGLVKDALQSGTRTGYRIIDTLGRCTDCCLARAGAENIVGVGIVGAVVVAGIALKLLLKR